MAADIVRNRQDVDEPAGERRCVRRLVVGIYLHDSELVSAETRERIGLADALANSAPDCLQQIVADRMTERIIDIFEMVEVEAQHRDLLISSDAAERLFQGFGQHGPIRKVGQRIVARHVRDLRLGLAPFGDVFVGRHPSAALHRVVGYPQHAAVRRFHDFGIPLAISRLRHDAVEELVGIAGKIPRRLSVLEQIKQRAPLKELGRDAHQFTVTLIEQNDASGSIEHAQPLRHVLQSGVQKHLLIT